MPLTDRQIADAAAAAGFRGKALVTAVAVALAESGGNPNATHRNAGGSVDYGLWQINSVHRDLLRTGTWSDPNDNARMAYRVYADAGHRFTPWVTYTTGRYFAYVGRAKNATAARSEAGGPSFAIPAGWQGAAGGLLGGGVVGGAASAWHALNLLTSGNVWIRVGMFVAGGALLVWALLSLTTVDNTIARIAGKAAVIA